MTETTRPIRSFCTQCIEETDSQVVRRPTTIEFRGREYATKEEFVRCLKCGYEYDQLGLEDPLTQVYEQYRREHDYPSSEDIQRLRHRMHLTEKEFGRLLNVCQKTVRLYERGALPKEEHAGLIKDLIERQTTVDSSLFDSMKSGQMNALFSIDLAQPQVNDWPNASPLNFTFRPTPPLQPDDRNCHLAA